MLFFRKAMVPALFDCGRKMIERLVARKKWIYAISAGCLCWIASPIAGGKLLCITVTMSAVAGFFLFDKFQIIPENYKIYSLLGAAVCICSQMFVKIFEQESNKEIAILVIGSIGALPLVNAVYGYFNSKYIPLFVGWIKKNRKTITVIILISTIIAMIYIRLTYMFYGGYNSIFSMDSIFYIETNTYSLFHATENDIRQPLFGAVAGLVYGPFNAIQWFDEKAYAVFLGVTNPMLVISGLALLASGFQENEEKKKFLFFCCSMFPSMLFMLCVEQYAIACFALMFLLHEIMSKNGEYAEAFVGATGSLITSAVLLPLCNRKKFPDIKSMGKCMVAFVCTVLICGRTTTVLDFAHLGVLGESYRYHNEYGEKLLQYTNYVRTVFLAPSAHMAINHHGNYEYQLRIITTVSIVGLFLLAICIYSVMINKEDKLVKIGAAWSLYSFFVLGVFGYGTKDNILPLYSLYFGWGYWVMIFSAFRGIKNKKVQNWLFYTMTICAGIFNIYHMIEIVQIGMKYYPA